MADIAMLVAEEYERRVKNSRKVHGGAANDEEMIELFPYVLSVSAKRVDLQESFSLIKKKIGEEKMDMVKRALQPKSEIGEAASNCFFSA
ncbi:hypothetical protein ACH5RR_012468 [Cinchona calisaya]|uniref:Uncharacterized protein n=1 Tax=Cinchona calisaya TaxID=153742 RepID=A0ABD3AAG3_9GENT